MPDIGLILLAAGGSTRMGSPKQLLVYEGKTLLRRAAETAAASSCRPVTVVLGCSADTISAELRGLEVETVTNPDWRLGMGVSIRCGMAALGARADAVVLMLCDQPLVTGSVIDSLIQNFLATGKPIVASEYGGELGVPALFARSIFCELKGLPMDEGAKRLIRRSEGQAAFVPFPGGTVDVDTALDYEALTRKI